MRRGALGIGTVAWADDEPANPAVWLAGPSLAVEAVGKRMRRIGPKADFAVQPPTSHIRKQSPVASAEPYQNVNAPILDLKGHKGKMIVVRLRHDAQAAPPPLHCSGVPDPDFHSIDALNE
jgi:hypothetical protein